MGKPKLLEAIKHDKGRVGEKERQRLLRKKAEKKKRQKAPAQANGDEWEDTSESEGEEAPELVDTSEGGVKLNGILKKNKGEASKTEKAKNDSDEDEQDEDSEEDEEEDEEEEDDDDDDASIALSDISDPDEDIVPHQTLTINNTAALRTALSRIEIPKSQPFSTTQALTVPTPKLPTNIHDDLARELAFYSQALDAAQRGRTLLKKEGIPFSRPTDFFAEMVKSDEHMGLVKGKLLEVAANKKAAQEARKLRDAKKFGKKVQQEKLQEREKEKKKMLEKIEGLKRKRASSPSGALNPNEPDFDVALEEAISGKDDKRGFNAKRQKRDQKYGFGGKKRHSKSNDAQSSSDISGFSSKAMKARGPAGKPKGKKRLGKSKRMARK